jgi:seryl-tRNA synthetase
MLDINFIKENQDLVKKGITNKGCEVKIIDEVLKIDERRRDLIGKIEILRSERNKLGKEDIEKGKKIKEELKEIEPDLNKAEEELRELLYQLPNLPADDVPVGKNSDDNVEIKKWGEPKKFDFKVKDHLEIGEALDIIDVKRAAKVSGSRFAYFRNEAVLLEMALVDLGMKTLIEKGFIPVLPPVINKKEVERGLGYVERGGWDQAYLFEKDEINFISSSEHTIIPQHMNEVLEEKQMPLRYVGFSTCFRREAGTYGKDTRGIFRVHQFDKIEMDVFTLPDMKISDKECLFLSSIQQEIMEKLELPYHVVHCCTGDLPFPNRRMYDLETWIPSQNRYRETQSCSNCTDFQTRRLNIKVKTKDGLKYAHALNATVLAIGRVIIAILENYQQKDGSVEIPKVLQTYTGFAKISPKK